MLFETGAMAHDKVPLVRYAEASYWDQRYAKESAQFDWFYGYNALRKFLRAFLPPNKLCLNIGCGNSNLQQGLSRAGYSIVNTDISEVIISKLKAAHGGRKGLTYFVSDCRCMPEFHDCQFGSVIDKGTVDALLCSSDADENIRRMFTEVARVLQPGGIFVLISLGEPASRLHMLQREYGWKVSVCLLPRVGAECYAKQVDGDDGSENDTLKPIDFLGPFSTNENMVVEGLPHPWNPTHYFYAYVCRRDRLVLSGTAGQATKLPETWCRMTKEVVERLRRDASLPPDLFAKGRRVKHVTVLKASVQDHGPYKQSTAEKHERNTEMS